MADRDASRGSAYSRGYGGRTWATLRRMAIVRDCSTCQKCGRVVEGQDCHIDHIVAKRHGGTDSLENLQVLCRRCHQSKTAGGN